MQKCFLLVGQERFLSMARGNAMRMAFVFIGRLWHSLRSTMPWAWFDMNKRGQSNIGDDGIRIYLHGRNI